MADDDLRAAERAEQRAWNAFCLVGDFDPDRGEEARRAWHAADARLEDAILALARGDG